VSAHGRLGRLVVGRRGPAEAGAGTAAAGPQPTTQRREAVRAGGATELHVGRKGFPMVRCAALDYSGAGLRAVLPPPELREGEEVDVYVRMPDGVAVEATAVVVRSEDHGVCAFRFVEIDAYQRELLIGHVFAAQQRGLAAARAAR
jgi:c-di-GMP-binding flagellar brake protein YcgR